MALATSTQSISSQESDADQHGELILTQRDTQPNFEGPEEWFTGTARITLTPGVDAKTPSALAAEPHAMQRRAGQMPKTVNLCGFFLPYESVPRAPRLPRRRA